MTPRRSMVSAWSRRIPASTNSGTPACACKSNQRSRSCSTVAMRRRPNGRRVFSVIVVTRPTRPRLYPLQAHQKLPLCATPHNTPSRGPMTAISPGLHVRSFSMMYARASPGVSSPSSTRSPMTSFNAWNWPWLYSS